MVNFRCGIHIFKIKTLLPAAGLKRFDLLMRHILLRGGSSGIHPA